MHLQTTRLSSLLGLGRKPVRKEYPLPPPSLVWLTFSGLGGLSGRRDLNIAGSARRGSGIPVYPKKIRQNTLNSQNSSKYTQNYTQVHFIPEIQRK